MSDAVCWLLIISFAITIFGYFSGVNNIIGETFSILYKIVVSNLKGLMGHK